MSNPEELIAQSHPRWRLLTKFEPARQPALVDRLPKVLAVFQLPPAQLDSIQEAVARALVAGQESCLRVWMTAVVLNEAQQRQPQNRWGFFITTRRDLAATSPNRLSVDLFLYQESGPGKAPQSPESSGFPPQGARDPPPSG